MKNKDIYEKYGHIILGSIEEIPRGHTIVVSKNRKIVSHGKIAVIKCENSDDVKCLKTRIINVQDAGQTKLCETCTRIVRNTKKRIFRRSKKLNQ